jgi:hypothetical protein
MADIIRIEIIGFTETFCSPFPCDETRTCGLDECHPTGKLVPAFESLKKKILADYGNRVELSITILDGGIPERVRKIIEADRPPLPVILINGKVTKIGRIAYDRIKKEIDSVIS